MSSPKPPPTGPNDAGAREDILSGDLGGQFARGKPGSPGEYSEWVAVPPSAAAALQAVTRTTNDADGRQGLGAWLPWLNPARVEDS